MPDAVTHPTIQELAAFGLGKLPERAAAAIAAHLESCPACRETVANLPPDSFLGKVRAAKPNASSLPARSGDAPGVEKASAASTPPKDLPPDLAKYSKYRFLRELGRGGMGIVYQAEQTVMGRTVAVKVINPSVLDHPDALPRFQSEVRAAAKLDHPNIVRAHDAEQVGSMHLLVMEYVEGASLADLVAKKGPLPVAYACHYIRQAALGLQHAFEQGMVHRDIKPQNLMVNARGQVKVLDFGLARMRSERKAGGGLTQVDAFMGTPEYVSPEQATDAHSADTRADIYSLGCTLFFLLAGRPPFQGDTAVKVIMAHIEKEAPAIHEVRVDVPAELSAVVTRMLAKDPARRFQTPLEVAQALASFVKPGTKPAAGVALPASGVSSPGTGTAIAVDTSKIKAILRDGPGKTPAVDAPAKEPASVFEGLGEEVASVKKKAKPAPRTAKPAPNAWYQRWAVLAGAGAAVLALGLGAWLLAGIVFKTKVKTADGILVIEVNEPNPVVLVDGERVTVSWHNGGKKAEIRVKPGTHKVEIQKDGFSVDGRELTFNDGGKEIFTARLLPKIPPQSQNVENTDNARSPAIAEEWIREVRAKAAEKQIEAVKNKLKELNPDFDGQVTPTIENGVVTGLGFLANHVTDISPLRALQHLKSLNCNSSGRGKIADLSPLKGMSLTKLGCEANRISDLSPLKGMPLEHLDCIINPVNDLSPLKSMPLKELQLWGWNGKDLAPLKGMPLSKLNCGGNGAIEDLSPLAGMPLTSLCVNCTKVSDLTPLKGMPLKELLATDTRVSDLTPLKGLPLTFLTLPPSVKDLSPLKGMSLKEILCPFQPERDAEILHSIKTLEKINGKPAAKFWKELDSTNTSAGPPMKTPRSDYDDLAKGRWVAVLPSVKEFDRLLSEKSYVGSEPKFAGGVLECKGAFRLFFPSIQAKDVIVRGRMKWSGRKHEGTVGFGIRNANGEYVGAGFNGAHFYIGRWRNRSWKDFTSCQLPEPNDGYFEFAFAIVGDRLFAYANGRRILEARDDAPLDRPVFVDAGSFGNCDGYFRNIEIQVLDKPSAPEEKGPAAEKGFVTLFNGKDTKGWKTYPKQRGNWHAEKGVLIGSGPATSHLYSSRGNYKDFHLRVEARINDGGNSGLYFRAPFGPIRPPNNPMFPQGYEAQINATHGDPKKTGSLIGLVNVAEAPHKPNEWFTEEVIAQGNHLVIKVNGKTTADYTDNQRLFTRGHIALQQADAATVVEFRKIEIKELPANPVSPEGKKTEVKPKPSGSTQRAKRIERWGMRWELTNYREYVAQLRGLGATLAIPVREDANGPEYEIVRDLSVRPAKLIKEEIKEIQRKEFWIDDKPDSVQGVMSVLGLRLRPSHFLAIFTEEVEVKLLRLEIDYLKQRHPGRSEDDIALTKFSLKVKGGKYVPEVVEQRLK